MHVCVLMYNVECTIKVLNVCDDAYVKCTRLTRLLQFPHSNNTFKVESSRKSLQLVVSLGAYT